MANLFFFRQTNLKNSHPSLQSYSKWLKIHLNSLPFRPTQIPLLLLIVAVSILILLATSGWFSSPSTNRKSSETFSHLKDLKSSHLPTSAQENFRSLNRAPPLATKILDLLPVRELEPANDYRRTEFGIPWFDVDANGCSTREDILRRDLKDIEFIPNSSGCKVASGILDCPYTGQRINFVRGAKTSSKVQIDHVVALNNAWRSGAKHLSATERLELANDPLNLMAVEGSANQDKSAGDAQAWLPPNRNFRCEYVARQISVKYKWHLWISPAEKSAMKRVLARCGAQRIIS